MSGANLATVTFLVRDYDEAIDWFTSKLEFKLLEDTVISATKRWVRVAAPSGGATLLLAKADNPEQQKAVGQAAGGRVAFFLNVPDFNASHQRMLTAGVRFNETPRHEPYGSVAVFEDLYGNKWDLIGK